MITINVGMMRGTTDADIAAEILKDNYEHGIVFTNMRALQAFTRYIRKTENDDLLRMLLAYSGECKDELYLSTTSSWWAFRAIVQILHRATERGLVSTLNNGGCNGRSDAVSMD